MALRVMTLLVLAWCLLAAPARALDPVKDFQHYVRDNWSVPEGLPQISALSIAQTPDGYIWAGTQAGLSRFDGVGFTTFTPSMEPALRHLFVRALAVDPDGALWIGTYAGLAVYRDGRFEEVPWTGAGDAPLISTIRIAADGSAWATTTAGIAFVRDGRLHPLEGAGPSRALAFTPNGQMWTADASGGVQRWDGTAWFPTHSADGTPTAAQDLLVAGDTVWAATASGLQVHGRDGWRPVAGASGSHAMALRFVFRDGDGNIWAGGDRGLVRVRPDGTVEHVRATPTNGLANLFTAFEDREGNLWLGSLSNGLSRIRNGWTRRYSTGQGLSHGTVWSLAPAEDGDGIWVSGNGGVARLRSNGRFEPIPAGPEVSSTTIALLVEPGQVWIGLQDGVALYEPGSGRPAAIPGWARAVRGRVRGLSRDHDGHLWIGTDMGLSRWNGSTLKRFGEEDGLHGLLADYGVATLSDGRRLALTRAGLFEFDGIGFRPAPEGEGLPADNVLFSLNILSGDSLLLSDLGDSLLFRHHGRWHRVDASAGLPPGNIFRVFEQEGTAWITNMSSVYRLEVDELKAFAEGRIARIHPQVVLNERGTPNSGQQGICCNGAGPNDGFIADGALWVPTRDGALAIDIPDIHDNPHPPSVHLGRVRVGDEWRTLDITGATVLEADERDLTLTFDVLSFQEPRSNHARYRLHGYDRAWRPVEPLVREVRYTNLPPGDYAFEVMGSNNSGLWTDEPTRLEFSIRPWFHETAAFRLLLAAAALLLVYAGFRYQRHRYRLRQAELQRLVDERTAELAESNRQLELASLTDPLTGLHNRRYLVQQIPADLNYYDRQLAAPAADVVVFSLLDLDHFKQVNDVHGHAAGDRVLSEAAVRLQRLVRAGDYVVRWGGEEFLLVFRPMSPSQVAAMGERLRHAIGHAPFDIGDGRSVKVTASVGLSEYPLFRDKGAPLGWEAMVELADQALYHVKRNGRDGWAMFRPTPTTRMDTLMADLQRDLARLLRDGELELVGNVGTGAGSARR